MRQIVLGSFVAILGAVLLIASLAAGGNSTHYGGAYGAGSSAGESARIPIAVVLLLAGAWAVRKGMQQRSSDPR
jgi:hypothetical protein